MRINLAKGKPSCSKDYPPLPKLTTESKCNMFWKLASETIAAEKDEKSGKNGKKNSSKYR